MVSAIVNNGGTERASVQSLIDQLAILNESDLILFFRLAEPVSDKIAELYDQWK